MEPNDLAQWSSFWRQGFITTFGAGKAGNYDGLVRKFWVDHFVDLPARSRVLDIATGNGAIATLAAQISEGHEKNFFVAASDLAEIQSDLKANPQAARLRANIHFHSHTPCERQPFEDGSFDLVTSQFGFEYSNVKEAVREIRRVLAPGGTFIAICHHADSSLIEKSRKELEVYHSAFDGFDLFGHFRKYLDAVGDLSAPPEELARAMKTARPLSKSINQKMDTFRQRHDGDECAHEIVGAISSLAKSARNTEKPRLMKNIVAAEQEFQFARDRLRDMVRAALGTEQVDNLAVAARAVGFETVQSLELYAEDNALAGWQIHIR